MKDKEVFKQDLEQKEEVSSVFVMHLLMEEDFEMPDPEFMLDTMKKSLGDVEQFSDTKDSNGFIAKNYKVDFKDSKSASPILMVMKSKEMGIKVDDIARGQMWDCPNSEEILEKCKYGIIATDMLAGGLDYKERAEMSMNFLEALVLMFPTCKAVLFQTSKKMFTREQILNNNIDKKDRFIQFAVNVRFFNIHGTNDSVVDTLGMGFLGLPDLQYHFHEMDPNWVVNHAYNTLVYIYENNCPFESGHTIAGVTEGKIDVELKWVCQFENSLIQPIRSVLDICMGENASGGR